MGSKSAAYMRGYRSSQAGGADRGLNAQASVVADRLSKDGIETHFGDSRYAGQLRVPASGRKSYHGYSQSESDYVVTVLDKNEYQIEQDGHPFAYPMDYNSMLRWFKEYGKRKPTNGR